MTTAPNEFWDEGWFAPQQTLDQELITQLNFVPGLREALIVRQVHALEHATVWMLTEIAEQFPAKWRQGYAELGGMSTENGFYLYGAVDKVDLYRAVANAGDRLRNGEWHLAVHPRCGTNLSVGLFLTAGLAAGASWLLPKDPLSQLIGMGTAAATAMAIAPEVGRYAQRYLTTSIPFNLTMMEIEDSTDIAGNQSHFVRLRWQDAQ
ncbi:DUF6391 domain-containing protein [[Limnothrix rosea] IAM M-220]|uniref:DUF6391 domain-containing protein n=1 Tax=[Limnothrix rosea] IAM M-220 TaxID=454133 RepID=UPI00095AFE43|nr:DUF6391 domain-containing protein [[Limnothrix rosea] IAM M-220]OKH17373.1 hypothetical protein NIES208_09805 [[Limnothrix rosea] IAM M-220]